jgi:hypothetical protein
VATSKIAWIPWPSLSEEQQTLTGNLPVNLVVVPYPSLGVGLCVFGVGALDLAALS